MVKTIVVKCALTFWFAMALGVVAAIGAACALSREFWICVGGWFSLLCAVLAAPLGVWTLWKEQLLLQKQNEVVQAEADAKKAVAQADGEAAATLARAKAQAEANRILGASITPTLVEYRRVDKWDGTLPMYGGGTGGMGLMLSMPAKK